MFVGVRDLVETPQGVVSSAVWLARGHKIEDFFRDVFGSAFSTRLNVSGSLPEGEMSVRARFADSARHRESRVIECRPQRFCGVGGKSWYSVRDRLIDLGVPDVSAWIIGIWLDKHLVRVSIEESLRQRVQFGDVILGVPNGEANAV